MSKRVDFQGQPFHFIGIGGIGMSALAYILAKRSLPVSGSDLRSSHITERLQSVGAHIFNRQEEGNLAYFQKTQSSSPEQVTQGEWNQSKANGSSPTVTTVAKTGTETIENPSSSQQLPQVICSTAIQNSNAEYRAAQELGCAVFHRSDVLAALIQEYDSIAVAGTHGKTTTSSLISYMLLDAGLDPTVVVGGEVNAIGGNARLGSSPYLVAEADESDGSLTKLKAKIGIVTNIELDHPDHYQSLEEVIQTFQTFANQCEQVIGCIDCDLVRNSLKPQISYSLSPERKADYTVTEVSYQGGMTKAQVWERGVCLGKLTLKLLGSHNLSNALAAVAVGRCLGLTFKKIAAGIASFEGAKRRFEKRGEAQGIVFIDDYAHHPSEIQVTLAAAKLRVAVDTYNGKPRRLVAVFQPHRYSRTQTFLEDFAQSFQDADVVIVTGIYGAGEANLGQVSSQTVVDAIAAHHSCVFHCPNLDEMTACLEKYLQPGDMALFLGAGNLNQVIPKMIDLYNAQTPAQV